MQELTQSQRGNPLVRLVIPIAWQYAWPVVTDGERMSAIKLTIAIGQHRAKQSCSSAVIAANAGQLFA